MVLPGTNEIFASPFLRTKVLISDDLPTLDRPIKAYSGRLSLGNLSIRVLLIRNSAFVIFIFADVVVKEMRLQYYFKCSGRSVLS